MLAVLCIAFQQGSLNLSAIVENQGSWPWQWNIACQPLAFLIFLVCAFAETNRAPFDMPEAESELTAGFHTEYSGMGFGMFFMAEYANMVVVSGVCTALFLGGWKGPGIDGVWWFMIKVYALLALFIWVALDLSAGPFRPVAEHQLEMAHPSRDPQSSGDGFLMKVF